MLIRELIVNSFEKHIWSRYIRDLSFQPSIETLYATALANLNKHETEKAITYIILTVEADINYIPVQHLARTMLYGLSEEFIRKKGPAMKEKYPDLIKHLFALEQTLIKTEKNIMLNQNNLSKLNSKLAEGFSLSSFLKKKEYSNQVTGIKEEINILNNEIPKLKKEIAKISEIIKIEEYTKVIAFVLEVITHPKRFLVAKIY